MSTAVARAPLASSNACRLAGSRPWRRAVYLEDKIAAARAAGEEPPSSTIDLYTRVANGQRRHCEALGWKRTPRDITPSISAYIDATVDKKDAGDE
jgi:hypothetical protein